MLTRRDFLRNSAGFAAGTALGNVTWAATAAPIIDTHTHFYDPERPEGVPWPGRNDKSLYRQVLPQHLREVAQPLGVTGTIVVEASPWVEDNQWLLDLAQRDRYVLGVVGNLNPGAPEFAGHLKRFAANPLYRGIRVNSGALKAGLECPEFLDDVRRLTAADLELDLNGGPELLPLVDSLAGRLPDQRIVINHLSNVRIDGPNLNTDWVTQIRAAARHPKVFMKVSALVESAARDGRTAPEDPAYYVPVLDVVWQAFGEDRVIYGSNWPVSDRAGSYATVLKIVRSYFDAKGTAAAAKFFAQNARAAYQYPNR